MKLSTSSKRGQASFLIKMLIGVALLVAVGFLGWNLIGYGKEVVGGFIGGRLDACPSDNTKPFQCYCNNVLINTKDGTKEFDKNKNEFCCDGKNTTAPCICLNVNSCAGYDSLFPQGDTKRDQFCNDNVCSPYFNNGKKNCGVRPGGCVEVPS